MPPEGRPEPARRAAAAPPARPSALALPRHAQDSIAPLPAQPLEAEIKAPPVATRHTCWALGTFQTLRGAQVDQTRVPRVQQLRRGDSPRPGLPSPRRAATTVCPSKHHLPLRSPAPAPEAALFLERPPGARPQRGPVPREPRPQRGPAPGRPRPEPEAALFPQRPLAPAAVTARILRCRCPALSRARATLPGRPASRAPQPVTQDRPPRALGLGSTRQPWRWNLPPLASTAHVRGRCFPPQSQPQDR
ncbi:proline-rich protein 2-like [Perognathus longimembris pacificus]|uniref:proline-rich protein 2-like n=1 Tax=Perognathus longimembris pacificus TaxID=214514 RepID=UPI002018FF48|nr:proline-rich protein 2-like [Perognathus longimembris pacificus]